MSEFTDKRDRALAFAKEWLSTANHRWIALAAAAVVVAFFLGKCSG